MTLTTLATRLLSRPCSSSFAAAVYAGAYPRLRQTPGASSQSRSFHLSARVGQAKAALPQTSAAENIELSQPIAFVSESDDPWLNLSYEDWLLRNTPHNQPVLFLYQNRPCVVIGRNQNPWQETTPRQLEEWDIPLIRRRSGGGTVFHDMGNTNFSIILPRLLFTRAHGAELVSRAIRERLGIRQCTVNERNDVIIRDGARDLKVSGSAYKIIQHRAYHHGTMLISSDLSNLGKSLKSRSPNIQGKSVTSFRSAVTTLNTYLPLSRSTPLGHDDFAEAVLAEFGAVYAKSTGEELPVKRVSEQVIKAGSKACEKLSKGIEELRSWEWTYGQTPEFQNTFEGDLSIGKVSVSVTARHAHIQSISLKTVQTDSSSAQTSLDEIAPSLIGRRYATLDGAEDGSEASEVRDEVLSWLRSTM